MRRNLLAIVPPHCGALFALAASAALLAFAGCGGPAPAPSNSNPFGDVTAGDPSPRPRPPVAPSTRPAASSSASAASGSPGEQGDAPVIAAAANGDVSSDNSDSAATGQFGGPAVAVNGGGSHDATGNSQTQVASLPSFGESPPPGSDGNGADETLTTAKAVDWAQFRGPGGSGISPYDNIPVTWSDDENLAWRVLLPGRGASSPIVVGDRVIVTYYAGYGVEDARANPANLQRWIVSYDRYTGVKQWEEMARRIPRVTPYRGEYITQHGYASGTPVSDGERIYAPFDAAGVLSIGVDGTSASFFSIGQNSHKWGSGSSPILYGDLFISNAAVESGVFGAIRTGTGQLAWGVQGIEETWATPLLVELPGSRPEVILPMKGKIIGVDAQTGLQLWRCDWLDDYIVPSMVEADGVVYAIGGRSGKAIAIQAGGRGNVTGTHVLWQANAGSNVPSPVVHEGHLYFVNEDGIAYCLDARTGDIITERRVETGEVYASPIIAGDKLYVVSRRNGTFVFEANPEMKLTAQNRLSGDDSLFNASPAVADGQIILRSDRYLYGIREQ